MIEDIEGLIGGAVEEVFSTMLSSSVRPDTQATLPPPGEPQLAGCVSFVGLLTGVVRIYTSMVHARGVTCQLLGLEAKDLDNSMVNDAMGEVTNMIGGHFKSHLCDRGYPCRLSIPSIVRGTNFTIESAPNTTRKVMGFVSEKCALVVEVVLKETAPK